MRLKTYKTPTWAERLIAEVCNEEGIRVPSVTWQKRPMHRFSSGRAGRGYMRVTAGGDRKEVKQVVLHELVHVIQGHTGFSGGGYGHDAEFYAKLFEIGKRHGIGAMAIKKRENWYKPRGVKQGYRLYLRRQREAQATAKADAIVLKWSTSA